MWVPMSQPLSPSRRFFLFFRRATHLRCPECGQSPIFVPAGRVRSLWDWFTPLDGCPRCGYAYEREQGYFLLATWAVNYGVVAGLGMMIALTLDYFLGLTLRQQILYVIAPMPLFSFLFARHAKAYYLALDHFCDPHRRADGAGDDPPAPIR